MIPLSVFRFFFLKLSCVYFSLLVHSYFTFFCGEEQDITG